MKFLHQSATEAFTDGNSVGRFINFAQGDRPRHISEADPDAAEVAQLDALKLGVIGEAREEERSHLLQTTIDAAIDRVSGDINAIRRFNGFEVGEDGAISVIIYRSIGGTERNRLLFSADDIVDSGFTTDELLNALNYAAPRFAETGAFAADVDPGAARIVDMRTADPDAASLDDPIRPVIIPEDPNAAAVIPLEVPIDTAPGNFASDLNIEEFNTNLEAEDKLEDVQFDALTNSYVVVFENGDRVTIPGAGIGSTLDLIDALREELGVEAPVEKAPEGAQLDMNAEAAQEAIKSLEGLTGADLQTRINELATQLGITFPEGRYVENGLLKVDGSIGGTTRNALNQVIEVLQGRIPLQAEVYGRVLDDIEGEITAQSIETAIKADPEARVLTCQLQVDLGLLKREDGTPYYTAGVDGAWGAGTRGGLTAALEAYGSLTAFRRAARIAEVEQEAEINDGDGRTNRGLDLVAQGADYVPGSLEEFLAEYKVTADMPADIAADPERAREWIIGQAIAMGDRENASQTRLTFIDGLSQYGNDNIRDVMRELRRNFETNTGRTELAEAMGDGVAVTQADFMEPVIDLGGRRIDTSLLDTAYIATGSDVTRDIDGSQQRGTMEVPIWLPDGSINPKFAELEFTNATYINGAIVMTMGNGCEGNLVIIPVQREKYTPPPVVPVQPRQPREPREPRDPRTPRDPEPTPTPEGPTRRCRTEKDCQGGRIRTRQICWDEGSWGFGNTTTRSPWMQTTESCNNGGDGDGCSGCGAGSGGDDSEGTGGNGL